MNPRAFEVNFDGIVGPTHNYGGLSYGNIPSQTNKYSASNPREAALQGLEKMKFLADLGLKQAVLPPHERPHVPTLRTLGYSGTDAQILEDVFSRQPELLYAVSSAAGMWTANAATVSPSADTFDRKVHFTPASLTNKLHRSIEAETTSQVLKTIFKDERFFVHHPPLPHHPHYGDEGAANHCRFSANYGSTGIELFVYGRDALDKGSPHPHKFPARQTLQASHEIGRLHLLLPSKTLFVQQNPVAIDAGAFHNDVVAVSNLNTLLFHEEAFLDSKKLFETLQNTSKEIPNLELKYLQVPSAAISIEDAVKSYLFNSQLITLENGSMALIAPSECEENPKVLSFLNDLIKQNDQPIRSIHFMNLRQSMKNGGGPACLRLRVVLTKEELEQTSPYVFLNTSLYEQLKAWIQTHYRDKLLPEDFRDPQLLEESRTALDALTKILHLGSIYNFQKSSP